MKGDPVHFLELGAERRGDWPAGAGRSRPERSESRTGATP